jgi:hypothetical protein
MPCLQEHVFHFLFQSGKGRCCLGVCGIVWQIECCNKATSIDKCISAQSGEENDKIGGKRYCYEQLIRCTMLLMLLMERGGGGGNVGYANHEGRLRSGGHPYFLS